MFAKFFFIFFGILFVFFEMSGGKGNFHGILNYGSNFFYNTLTYFFHLKTFWYVGNPNIASDHTASNHII